MVPGGEQENLKASSEKERSFEFFRKWGKWATDALSSPNFFLPFVVKAFLPFFPYSFPFSCPQELTLKGDILRHVTFRCVRGLLVHARAHQHNANAILMDYTVALNAWRHKNLHRAQAETSLLKSAAPGIGKERRHKLPTSARPFVTGWDKIARDCGEQDREEAGRASHSAATTLTCGEK